MPERLAPVADQIPREAVVGVALFLMALTLDASSIWQALRHPKAVILAVAINFVLLPLTAWAIAGWLPTVDLAVGLLIVLITLLSLAVRRGRRTRRHQTAETQLVLGAN